MKLPRISKGEDEMAICTHRRTAVINSGKPGTRGYIPNDNILVIRRRKCLDCDYRMTTYEIKDDQIEILVDGIRQKSEKLISKLKTVLEEI